MNAKFCRFCEISEGINELALHDKPFLRSTDAFAIPSIGALVEGWSLVCPVKHSYAIRELYDDDDFMSFVRNANDRVQAVYGNTILFEHGSSYAESLTGCGTDHAHLHIVPFDGISLDDLLKTGLDWKKTNAKEIAKLSTEKEYLFICTNPLEFELEIEGYLHIVEKPSSQFFRRLIANKLGNTVNFNYKNNPLINVANKSASKLASESILSLE